jgi:uncharacterized protein (DUF1501 family)
MLSRRDFMKRSALLALAPSVPAFVARAAHAATLRPGASDGRVLVVLHLAGGNDAINTLVPFGDERYEEHRVRLRLPKERLIRIDERVALHPSMAAMKKLLERGQLAIVQGVGYPNPNRSHDVSTAIWNTARFDREEHAGCGWIGRACDAAAPLAAGTPASILVGPDALPAALKARKSAAVALNELDDVLRIDLDRIGGPAAATGRDDSVTDFVERTAVDARVTAQKLKAAAARAKRGTAYPQSELARRLQLVAQLIEAGFETPVYYALHRGYDTHTAQLETQASLLRELSEALLAFEEDLAQARLAERVVVVGFSEFGRRLQENASFGTDHGTAGLVFVSGVRVRAGLHGAAPDLGDLDAEGDPKPTVDFRSIYAELLQHWLRVPDEASLGGTFEPLALLAS